MKTNTETDRIEERKEYQKQADKLRISFRLGPKERTILEAEMKKEGWVSRSNFIRYKLFGSDIDERLENVIKTKDPETVENALRNTLLALSNQIQFFRWRYERDMRQLYKEEGVDLRKWISATNDAHNSVLEKLNDAYTVIKIVASELGFKNFFVAPSTSATIDFDNVTDEELDAIAQQIMQDDLALGIDTFK